MGQIGKQTLGPVVDDGRHKGIFAGEEAIERLVGDPRRPHDVRHTRRVGSAVARQELETYVDEPTNIAAKYFSLVFEPPVDCLLCEGHASIVNCLCGSLHRLDCT